MSILPHLSIVLPSGILHYDPSSKKVTPDSRQGSLHVYQNTDGEKRFIWKNEKNESEVDIYVFTGDAIFEKVVKAKGRVYLLRFESNEDKYFFWMQGGPEEEAVKKINEIINAEEEQGMEEEEEKKEEEGGNKTENKSFDNDFIKNLAQKLQEKIVNKRKEGVILSEVLKSSFLNTICEDEDFVNDLIPLLPEGQQTLESLKDNLKSPQFLQALESLEYALNSESGTAVLLSLGIDPDMFFVTQGDGVEALLKGLINMEKKLNK